VFAQVTAGFPSRKVIPSFAQGCDSETDTGPGCPQIPELCTGWSPRCAPLDNSHQLGDLVVDRAPFLHLIADLFDRMDDCRVISPAELASDGRIAEVGHLPHHVHGDLPGGDE